MKYHLIAERYARGLAAAIEDGPRLERALALLKELHEVIATHHDFRSCVCNPTIDLEKRAKVLEHVVRRLSDDDVVLRLCNRLLERERILLVGDIAEILTGIVDARFGRVSATVTTSVPLTTQQEDHLRESLVQYSGKEVRMDCRVDPEIIGGVVARIGGQVIDGSLRTRLERIKDALIAEEL
jgi:F-type H+-transporting ATPase subunit delta